MNDPRPDDQTPQPHHRLAAMTFIMFGNAALLTFALVLLSGACLKNGDMSASFALICAGLLPFIVTTQVLQDTPMAERMRTGRMCVVTGLFAMAVLAGPGPSFMGVACTTGPTMVQTATGMMIIAWLTWLGLRFADPDLQRN